VASFTYFYKSSLLDWLEVSVQAGGEAAEAVSEVFNRYGQGGVVIEEAVGETDEAVGGTTCTVFSRRPIGWKRIE
jgi:hypothetical protein